LCKRYKLARSSRRGGGADGTALSERLSIVEPISQPVSQSIGPVAESIIHLISQPFSQSFGPVVESIIHSLSHSSTSQSVRRTRISRSDLARAAHLLRCCSLVTLSPRSMFLLDSGAQRQQVNERENERDDRTDTEFHRGTYQGSAIVKRDAAVESGG